MPDRDCAWRHDAGTLRRYNLPAWDEMAGDRFSPAPCPLAESERGMGRFLSRVVAMISVSCSCGRRFKAEDHYAGKRTKCPVCGNMLVIGQSAVTGPSGVSDNGEVPSWWFPSNPGPRTTATATPPTTRSGSGSGSDPDELPTMVIPSQAARPRDDSAHGTMRPPAGGPGRSRLLTGLFGGL